MVYVLLVYGFFLVAASLYGANSSVANQTASLAAFALAVPVSCCAAFKIAKMGADKWRAHQGKKLNRYEWGELAAHVLVPCFMTALTCSFWWNAERGSVACSIGQVSLILAVSNMTAPGGQTRADK